LSKDDFIENGVDLNRRDIGEDLLAMPIACHAEVQEKRRKRKRDELEIFVDNVVNDDVLHVIGGEGLDELHRIEVDVEVDEEVDQEVTMEK
jgi:hypothetical protein